MKICDHYKGPAIKIWNEGIGLYADNIIDHNLFYNNGSGTVGNDQNYAIEVHTANHLDINTLIASPVFEGSGDIPDPFFTLQEVSPAIDAGIDVGLPYNGGAPDIGAYEYGGPVIAEEQSSIPSTLNLFVNSLSGNRVVFSISFETPGNYSLDVYNIKGEKLWYNNGNKANAGKHLVAWNLNTTGNNRIGNGVYFCILSTGRNRITKSFVVIR